MPIMEKKNSEWFNDIEEPIEIEFDDSDDDVDFGKSEYEDDFGIDTRTGLPFGTSYDPDAPDWDEMEREFDIGDNEYSDEELANIYGGDLTYCTKCGKRLAMDDGYSYCPDCEPKRIDENSNFDDWVRYDKEGTIVSTNADGYTLLKMDDAGLNSDVFHWIVKDNSGKIIFDTGRLRYGSSISWTSRKERHWTGAYVYGDAVILKCIANKYGFSDQDILNHIDGEMQDRYKSAMGKSEYKHLNWSDAVTDAESSNVIDEYIVKDTLLEAPMVKLSDDQLNNPSDINFGSIIKDTAEKERLDKEAKEREARRLELSQKYSHVLYAIDAVTDDSEGIEIGKLHAAFEELVPPSGKADSVAGELVRAAARIYFRYYNDGDYFFMGYGLETAGPSAAYLIDMGFDDVIYQGAELGQTYSEYGIDSKELDKQYEDFIRSLADKVVTYITENVETLSDDNTIDSRDYDSNPDSSTYSSLVEEQPRFDYDFEISYRVRELLDEDIISYNDVEDYVDNWIYYENACEGATVSVQYDYVVIENLTYDGHEFIEDVIRHHGEHFWDELEQEHESDEEESYSENEDGEDYDDDYEDYDESLNLKYESISINPFNPHKTSLNESLLDRLVLDELPHKDDTNSFYDEEDGIAIDIQDREEHEHSMRGPKRWASPKVRTKTWGRIWKDGNVEHFHGPKYSVRADMAKRLRGMSEKYNPSSNEYMLQTADEILGNMIGNVPDDRLDAIVTTTERIAKKLGVSKLSDMWVLTIDDAYSPDWAGADKLGTIRVVGNTIQHWSLKGINFAELRIKGQGMLFFTSETDAHSYVDIVDEENLNEGYHSNSEEYSPFFPEDYSLRDEQTPNAFIQTTEVSHNGKRIGSIQKHPKRGGTRKNDSNRVLSTYYVAISNEFGQTMVNTPEEAVNFILGKSNPIKESFHKGHSLNGVRDIQNKKQ